VLVALALAELCVSGLRSGHTSAGRRLVSSRPQHVYRRVDVTMPLSLIAANDLLEDEELLLPLLLILQEEERQLEQVWRGYTFGRTGVVVQRGQLIAGELGAGGK